MLKEPQSNKESADVVRKKIESVYRGESRRILATLIRLLGDFDTAEEAMHDAFSAAMEQWQRDGIPDNPGAWLVSAGRFKAIDGMRRHARIVSASGGDASIADITEQVAADTKDPAEQIDDVVADDQLRLIFTCCHPALAPDARIALTLREVCGLTTEEIARAYLTPPSTLAQRIVRAKAKIRDARIPYQVPSPSDLPERLSAVLHVIYLVFNEGYSASSGTSLTRADLSGEAIRLGRLLMELLPAKQTAGGLARPISDGPEPEVIGLLALMLLQESRRTARTSPEGDLILLEDQDRSLWNRDLITEGIALVERALSLQRFGAPAGQSPFLDVSPYTIQAAIAALHAEAPNPAATDWTQIVALYDVLLNAEPSPIIELNRAVAVAMRDGSESGLQLIDAILSRGDLADYHLIHSARADLCRRLGRKEDAKISYERALSLVQLEPERRFLERRLRELS
jgi:RNA polymerase sigma-70 factor (ECF subfamily)